MGEIREFTGKQAEENTEGRQRITMPTKEEITALNMLTDMYGKDEMVDVAHWNGSCLKSFVEMVDEHAKKNNLDIWDCRAVMMTKFLGTVFEVNDDGSVTVTSGGI